MAAFIKYFYPGINLIFLFQLLLIVSMKRTFLGKEDEAKCSAPLQFILPAAFRKGGGSEGGECIVFMYLSVKTWKPVFSFECRMMMWIPDVVGHGQFIITPTFPSSISVPTRGIMWPDKTEECSTCHHMGQSV